MQASILRSTSCDGAHRPSILFLFRKPPALLLWLSFSFLAQFTFAENQYQVLHAFTDGLDGGGVWDTVSFDANGNIYGTTSGGGEYGAGVIFKLSPGPNGTWSIGVIHNFDGTDGSEPHGGVAFDQEGNAFGTTQLGGAYDGGVVYELTPGPDGWTYTVIQNLGGPNNPACCPLGNLALDLKGNIYGASYADFEVSPSPEGWVETVLHIFTGQNGDGYGPEAGPILDSRSNLYGTTEGGGGSPKCSVRYGCGTIYELQPVQTSVGTWRELILHRFGYSTQDGGGGPGFGQLAMGGAGNLYGSGGDGVTGFGTIYKLAPASTNPDVEWQETILYNFVGNAFGSTGVIFGRDGNMYGTATHGGGYGCGAIYRLSPPLRANGEWQFTLLHSFTGEDGCLPDANLTLGPDGNLYGTTATGGVGGSGVVFEITP